MKFRNYLETIAGIEIYPMFSLFLFMVFFSIVMFWTFKLSKSVVEHSENLPLE